MKPRTWLIVLSGAVFGFVFGASILGILFAAEGADLWSAFAGDDLIGLIASSVVYLVVLAPTTIAGAGSFAFFAAAGRISPSVALGLAGGALVGLAFGPPVPNSAAFDAVRPILAIIWEAIMGGVGAMIGRFVEARAKSLD